MTIARNDRGELADQAKAMLERWGVKALKAAIDKINYPGLDLSRVKLLGASKRTRGTPRT